MFAANFTPHPYTVQLQYGAVANAPSSERSAFHATDTDSHPISRMRAGSEHDEQHSSPKQHTEVACKSPAAAHKARKSGVLSQGARPIASTPSSCCFTEGDYPSDFSSLSHDCMTAGAATIDPSEAMLAASPTPPPPRRRCALGPDASGLPTPPVLKRSASKSRASNQVAAEAAPPSQPQKLKRALGSSPAHSRHSALVGKKQSPAPPVFGDATAADDDANSPTLATTAGQPNAQQSKWHAPGVATSPSDATNVPQRVTKVSWQAGSTPCSAAGLPARVAGAECHSVHLRTASSPMGPKQKRVCFERDAVAALSDAFSKFVPAASPVYSAQHSLVFEGPPAVTGNIGSKASIAASRRRVQQTTLMSWVSLPSRQQGSHLCQPTALGVRHVAKQWQANFREVLSTMLHSSRVQIVKLRLMTARWRLHQSCASSQENTSAQLSRPSAQLSRSSHHCCLLEQARLRATAWPTTSSLHHHR